jgi:DNA-binding winged helix-turn-helix (wHTH) protein
MTKLRFGDIEIDPAQRKIAVSGSEAKVGARAFDLLMALVERRDRIVTKGELLDVVWPGVIVEENNLAAQMMSLRKALGPAAFSTIPGRGYRFVLPGETVPLPTRPAAAASPVDPLVGRETELSELIQAMEQHRLVSVIGAGGIGKTRVAQAAASLWRDRHTEQGTAWVDLAAVGAPAHVTPAIAGACEARLESGDSREQLAIALAVPQLLLVLDNCEHLVDEAAACARYLLERCPYLRILTTSQVLLRVPGEHAYRLRGLSVPPPLASLAIARDHAAPRFLEQRVRTVDSRFSLTEENVRHAIALCERLDGSPSHSRWRQLASRRGEWRPSWSSSAVIPKC